MRFLGREIRRFWKPAGESVPYSGPGFTYESASGFSGVTVEQVLPVVQACLNRVTSQVGLLPRRVVNAEGQEVRKPLWVEKPNVYQDGTDLVQMIAASLLLHGNAYLTPLRVNGKVVSVAVANPAYVQPTSLGNGVRDYYFNGEKYTGEMVHIPYVSLAGRILGTGPWPSINRLVNIADSSLNYAQALVDSGGAYQLLLRYPEGVPNDVLKSTYAQFKARHVGSGNAWAPLLLSGEVEVKEISQTNADTQFLELARLTETRVIAFGFNLEPQDFGLGSSVPQGGDGAITYRSEAGRWWRMWRFALAPLVHRIEENLSNLLPNGHRLDLSQQELLFGGPHDRADIVQKLATANQSQTGLGDTPIVASEELRDMLGFPKRVDGFKLEKPTQGGPNGNEPNDGDGDRPGGDGEGGNPDPDPDNQ